MRELQPAICQKKAYVCMKITRCDCLLDVLCLSAASLWLESSSRRHTSLQKTAIRQGKRRRNYRGRVLVNLDQSSAGMDNTSYLIVNLRCKTTPSRANASSVGVLTLGLTQPTSEKPRSYHRKQSVNTHPQSQAYGALLVELRRPAPLSNEAAALPLLQRTAARRWRRLLRAASPAYDATL